ncbi:MAG: DNA-binding response regulator, partial [Bifidobacteriales bacterium]|nr:DNA-binding response regulator [Bifidobacteriales bacterium]
MVDTQADLSHGGDRHQATILVVDDDPRITALLMAALSKDGHAVTVINDSRKVTKMDLSSVDLILCDVM